MTRCVALQWQWTKHNNSNNNTKKENKKMKKILNGRRWTFMAYIWFNCNRNTALGDSFAILIVFNYKWTCTYSVTRISGWNLIAICNRCNVCACCCCSCLFYIFVLRSFKTIANKFLVRTMILKVRIFSVVVIYVAPHTHTNTCEFVVFVQIGISLNELVCN